MMRLDSLVGAIQSAVTSANQELQSQSDDFLKRYFFELAEAEKEEGSEGKTVLRPRYTTMEYPAETSKGIETLLVDVPLISLVPVVSSRIKEVTFRSVLEVSHGDDGSLNIGFPSEKKKHVFQFGDDKPRHHVAELEIKLTGDETPDGLQRLIEGYNRALRAQIPG